MKKLDFKKIAFWGFYPVFWLTMLLKGLDAGLLLFGFMGLVIWFMLLATEVKDHGTKRV